MTINYSVRADVYDITVDTPQAGDIFLVDTNVWYWLTYTKASQSFSHPLSYQTTHYPSYLNSALKVGAKIYKSGLTLAELTHLIEKAERDIYNESNNIVKTKEYRHNYAAERIKVVAEIQSAWGQVRSMADSLTLTIESETTCDAVNLLSHQEVDGYDLFILQSMQNNGVVKVLTDDGDFASVPNIEVYTANRSVLTAAREQGKLQLR